MANQLFHVVLTESPTGAQDFQVRAVAAPAECVAGSAPLGAAMVYVLSPVAARTARDARVHALAMIDDLGLRATPAPARPRRR